MKAAAAAERQNVRKTCQHQLAFAIVMLYSSGAGFSSFRFAAAWFVSTPDMRQEGDMRVLFAFGRFPPPARHDYLVSVPVLLICWALTPEVHDAVSTIGDLETLANALNDSAGFRYI